MTARVPELLRELEGFYPGSRDYQQSISNAQVRYKVFAQNSLRRKLVIQNIGPDPIEWGADDVTFGTGIRIVAGGNLLDDSQTWPGEVWVCAGTAPVGGIDVRAREEWLSRG